MEPTELLGQWLTKHAIDCIRIVDEGTKLASTYRKLQLGVDFRLDTKL